MLKFLVDAGAIFEFKYMVKIFGFFNLRKAVDNMGDFAYKYMVNAVEEFFRFYGVLVDRFWSVF